MSMQGLEDVKVLELGNMVSAAYATKIMADLGADVIKVEEPTGDLSRQRGPFPKDVVDPEQSGLFLHMNTNKRGCSYDLSREKDALQRLVAWADILVHNYPPAQMAALGLDYNTFREINPRLVMCSITPFGLSGPHKDYTAYELTVTHGGGWAWVSPGGSLRPDLPPLKAAGHQADFQGGVAAATVTLAAYYRMLQTGQGEHIDFSTTAYITSFVDVSAPNYTYQERIASRLGKRVLSPWGIFPCKDGLMFLMVGEEDQWQRIVELMGKPEWTTWDIFQGLANRNANEDVLNQYLSEWTAGWKVEELFHEAQAKRICFAPVFSMAQLARQEHLHSRNFFVDVTHSRAGKLTQLGAPYKLHEPWWKIRRPAPLLGEHNEEVSRPTFQVSRPQSPPSNSELRTPQRPLEGVRVADFSWVWAGPFCAMQLAHLGAEVIKIESLAHVDLARRLAYYPKGMEPGVNRCALFNQWGQGKKSLSLNLSTEKGLDIVKELIAKSDVVLQNFATGVMDGLGLGYEELKKIKPDIIMASISGYGQTGPNRNYMAYGPAIPPVAGLSSLTGYAENEPPQEVGMAYGDPTSGIHAAVGICAALAARKRTGQGQHIDVSLWESVASLIPEGWMAYAMNATQPPRRGNRDPWMSPHNCYRCVGDDEWVTIACGTESEWHALCRAIGQPQLANDVRFHTAVARKANEDTLDQILAGWTATRDKWEVTRSLQSVGVAAFPSMNGKDLVEDGHLNARGFFTRLRHSEVGVRTHMGMPWLLTNAPNGVRSPAPVLGQDTDQVMGDILGYSMQQITKLKAEKVLY
ncbi:MAG: CoA transferase [Deltaproteobacteria bacterium]|nr:CoA transferase [Deltaproteobacteria bacterium]